MTLRSQQTSSIALEDLRLLTAVAQAGSLSAAARRLQMNHSSAWRRLGTLEARLGVRLFDRDRTGYSATPAGEEAVVASQRLLSELDALERRLSGQDVRPSGVVRVTTTETLLSLLAPVLAALRSSHPGIVIELSTVNAFLTLNRREADIAVRPAPKASEGLVARKMGTIATSVYGAPAYLKGRNADPLSLNWLVPDDTLSHLGSARWIARNVEPEQIVHRASSLNALAIMARTGVGVAPLPCFIGDCDKDLMRMIPPVPEMATNLWLLTHPDLRRTSRIRVVLDALYDGMSSRAAQFAGKVA
jgi:molybdate transport repressor ModE-like protein